MSLEDYARQLAIIEDVREERLLDAARSVVRVDWVLDASRRLTCAERLRLAERILEELQQGWTHP
jgi:hypothetical protein